MQELKTKQTKHILSKAELIHEVENNINTFKNLYEMGDFLIKYTNEPNYKSASEKIIKQFLEELLYNYPKNLTIEDLKNLKDEEDDLRDNLSELADSYVEIYNDDLLESAKYIYDYIEDAKDEFGGRGDIIKDIQQGEYYLFYELFDLVLMDLLNVVEEIINENEN